MNVADYQAKSYPLPPCWALLADVYATELERGVLAFRTVSSSVRQAAAAFRLTLHKSAHGFHQISEPEDFAAVLLGKTPKLGFHHCGVYYQGGILHALEVDGASSVLYQDLASVRDAYQLMEFWAQ